MYNRILSNNLFMIGMLFLILILALSACAPDVPPEASAETGGLDELLSTLTEVGKKTAPAGEIDDAFFGDRAIYVDVNGDTIQVFEFTSEADREAAAETISGNGYIVGTSAVEWISQPYFFSQDRLIVLYVGEDASTVELLTQLLGEPITGPR